jgi:hypothetical protein
MHGLAAVEILDLWDHADPLVPGQRALAVLASADCAEPRPTAGHRDSLLLRIYAATYGPVLSAVATCPACGVLLDIDVEIARLLVDPPAVRQLSVETLDGDVSFRLPDAADLVESKDADELFDRCVGPVVDLDTRAEIENLMALGDPGAELQLSLTCPSCEHAWSDVLDPMSFLWAAMSSRVRRLLDEVDALARVYGWSEAEILRLSERRRSMYLEAIAG